MRLHGDEDDDLNLTLPLSEPATDLAIVGIVPRLVAGVRRRIVVAGMEVAMRAALCVAAGCRGALCVGPAVMMSAAGDGMPGGSAGPEEGVGGEEGAAGELSDGAAHGGGGGSGGGCASDQVASGRFSQALSESQVATVLFMQLFCI